MSRREEVARAIAAAHDSEIDRQVGFTPPADARPNWECQSGDARTAWLAAADAALACGAADGLADATRSAVVTLRMQARALEGGGGIGHVIAALEEAATRLESRILAALDGAPKGLCDGPDCAGYQCPDCQGGAR